METERVEMNPDLLRVSRQIETLFKRVNVRQWTEDEFIENVGSGTLRKNKQLGMRWVSQYREERVCYEFGWEFEILPTSRVTFNDALTEGDCKSLTEAGWHAERYLRFSVFPNDHFEVKTIIVEYEGGVRKEGVGIVVRQTSAQWIPKGHIVFAIIAEYDPRNRCYLPSNNPF